MYRKIEQELIKWKNSNYRKPLILQGARQVGKTYCVLDFGKKYFENVAYFNFQLNKTIRTIFEESLDPNYIVPILSRICNQFISPEKTLIVFDEVQDCDKALTSLKYFAEIAPQYYVIAAGSLLGVAVNRKQMSFPVGKVDRITLYPMDFEEFLIANNQKSLRDEIKKCYEKNQKLPAVLHEQALKLFRKYLFTGGMPEVVQRYIDTDNMVMVRQLQTGILADYLDDMSKYQESSTEIKKTILTYYSTSVQLSKTNTRFQYKLVKQGGRASEFENAIQWLCLSGIVSKVNNLDKIEKPLADYINIDAFKLYFSDCGLLLAQKNVYVDDIIYNPDNLGSFKGGMTENYVNFHLVCNGYNTYYFSQEQNLEIDFIAQKEGKIIPIEVKSGIHTKAVSLNKYIKRYIPEYSIRISEKNFGFENGIKSIPLYAVFCI